MCLVVQIVWDLFYIIYGYSSYCPRNIEAFGLLFLEKQLLENAQNHHEEG